VATLTPAAVRKQIETGKLDPVYLIIGADEAEKTALTSEFGLVVEEELRAFNVDRFYGGEASAAAIVDGARTVPLLVPKRIVIVSRAELVIVPKRESQATDQALEALTAYIKAPASHACLVLVAGEIDERRTLSKLLLQTASVVQCDGLGNPLEAATWLRKAAEAQGMAIDAKAVQLLINRAAGDPMRLRADAERLLLYLAGQRVITTIDVEAISTSAHGGGGEWAVTNAIERGAGAAALRELAAQLDEGVSPYLILGQLAWCVRTKLDRRQVPRAIEAVFQTDLALKSSGGDPRILLERLVVQLCCGSEASR
jgi:DNA polymerase-3 subunit delta